MWNQSLCIDKVLLQQYLHMIRLRKRLYIFLFNNFNYFIYFTIQIDIIILVTLHPIHFYTEILNTGMSSLRLKYFNMRYNYVDIQHKIFLYVDMEFIYVN